jgi:hypothetical protein
LKAELFLYDAQKKEKQSLQDKKESKNCCDLIDGGKVHYMVNCIHPQPEKSQD